MFLSGVLGFERLLDVWGNICREGKLDVFSLKGALSDVFDVILGEESVDVLIVINVVDHLGGCSAIGFGQQVGFHLGG